MGGWAGGVIGSSLFSMAENNRKLTAKNAKSAGNNPVFP
jgi:hypothetical protein